MALPYRPEAWNDSGDFALPDSRDRLARRLVPCALLRGTMAAFTREGTVPRGRCASVRVRFSGHLLRDYCVLNFRTTGHASGLCGHEVHVVTKKKHTMRMGFRGAAIYSGPPGFNKPCPRCQPSLIDAWSAGSRETCARPPVLVTAPSEQHHRPDAGGLHDPHVHRIMRQVWN